MFNDLLVQIRAAVANVALTAPVLTVDFRALIGFTIKSKQ